MTQCINLLLLKDVKTVWENKNEVDYKKTCTAPNHVISDDFGQNQKRFLSFN